MHTGFINSFFKVNFNSNFTQATCKLIYKIRLNCTIVYENHSDNSHILTAMGTSKTDTVILGLDIVPNVKYYFVATAISDRDTAVVEGTFTSSRQTGIILLDPWIDYIIMHNIIVIVNYVHSIITILCRTNEPIYSQWFWGNCWCNGNYRDSCCHLCYFHCCDQFTESIKTFIN